MKEMGNNNIQYTLRKSARVRRMRISVSCEGKVVVTMPRSMPDFLANNFIIDKIDWIKKTIVRFSVLPEWQKKKYTRKDYLNNKDEVRILVQNRLEYFNQYYRLNWQRISIRDQKSRWGSCSQQGNLNFNYKLLFLTPELQDYIVVHELCHLKEMNHSKRFWALVGETLPEYNVLRKKLKGGIK